MNIYYIAVRDACIEASADTIEELCSRFTSALTGKTLTIDELKVKGYYILKVEEI